MADMDAARTAFEAAAVRVSRELEALGERVSEASARSAAAKLHACVREHRLDTLVALVAPVLGLLRCLLYFLSPLLLLLPCLFNRLQCL